MFAAVLAAALTALSSPLARAQDGVLDTLGGGRFYPSGPDAGFFDGDLLLAAQFNQPFGLVPRGAGILILADTGNNAVRKLVIDGDCTTLIQGLNRPVGVAVDSADNLYVLTAGSGANGQILRYDRFDTLYQFPSLLNTTPLANPVALALDAGTNVYVVELGGALKRLPLAGGPATTVTNGLAQPGGIAILDSGLLAITESARNVVRIINPTTGVTEQTIGVPKEILDAAQDPIYFRDGPGNVARFHGPAGIARAPNNNLVVADRANHRVRLISVDGVVTTLYGVDPSRWEVECLNCTPMVLPGWYDGVNGDPLTAEARQPTGVTVASDGTLYATEQYYHIIRGLTGAGGLAPGSGGGGDGGSGSTNLVVLPPTVTPDSGYHPTGIQLTVSNPNTNAFFRNAVFYTTDGSTPTTNSTPVNLTNGVGTILWRDSVNSLASLRLRAFVGATGSAVVQGRRGAVTELGLSRGLLAGMGSTVLVPVVLNLQETTTNVVRSLQFRVEFKPTNGAPPLSANLTALGVSTNDFVPVATPATDQPASGRFSSYTIGTTRGVYAAYLGTNANFLVRSHAVVTMLSVPIPPTATPGQGYWVSILEPSGTSDGAEAAIPIAPMSPKLITVTNVSYIVGDSSPGAWYNAETSGATPDTSLGFGNGNLRNSDVNNAFSVALGTRNLSPASDLFDAMDAYPTDSAAQAGGDGQVRFLDWQVILLRSLILETNNWRRTWSAGGVRVATPAALNTNALDHPAATFDGSFRAQPWRPPAQLASGFREFMEPGTTAQIPIAVHLQPGTQLAGMQFRIAVRPLGSTPGLLLPIRFVANTAKVPEPIAASGLAPNEAGYAWSLIQNPFSPALASSTLLGTLEVTVPDSVRPGDGYEITFSHASGARDFTAEYEFDLASGSLHIGTARPDPGPAKLFPGLKLSWFGALGVLYAVETSADLQTWFPLASDLTGTGRTLEFVDTQPTSPTRFYRIIESR